MAKGLEGKVCEECLRSHGLFWPEVRRMRGGLKLIMASCNSSRQSAAPYREQKGNCRIRVWVVLCGAGSWARWSLCVLSNSGQPVTLWFLGVPSRYYTECSAPLSCARKPPEMQMSENMAFMKVPHKGFNVQMNKYYPKKAGPGKSKRRKALLCLYTKNWWMMEPQTGWDFAPL